MEQLRIAVASPRIEGAGIAAPAASGGGDIAEEAKPGHEAGGGGNHDAFAMPKEAVGTIQIDKLLTAAVKGGDVLPIS
jgi:hypothetical protein